VEACGQSCEVDVFADGDAGEESVATGWLGVVRIDVDDDQAGGAAGDADAEVGVTSPPLVDPAMVDGGGVEAVAPATLGNTGALSGAVPVSAAGCAVRGRCLAACGKRKNGPASAGAPPGSGERWCSD
jgi:hypothetical protein